MTEVSKKRERTDEDERIIQKLEMENKDLKEKMIELEKRIKLLNEDHKETVRSIRRTNSDGECRKCWKYMCDCNCSSFSSDDE
jgi:predicted RNase H-like nuclease (RuvC/YqgF family)